MSGCLRFDGYEIYEFGLGSFQTCVHGTLPRLKKSDDLRELFRLKCVTKRGHVHAAVNNGYHDVALGKCVTYVSEISGPRRPPYLWTRWQLR
jgi:hypothetical protein